MNFLKDRSAVLAVSGAGLALVAGLSLAWVVVARHRGESSPPPPASQAGLVIDAHGGVEAKADPAKPLRCFVGGQFVGDMTLADCARRNGVATDALDVGLDPNGALAAANQAGEVLTPLPPPQAERAPAAATPDPALAGSAPGAIPVGGPPAACWRYADNQWRRLPGDLPLGSCVQTLFTGRCERPGGATYGRWGPDTLRLIPGRVEISGDNHSFRTLVEPWPGCP
ncbi:MAG TPA: hypothetical protein VGC92_11270 [Phenylobacterium sp.]|jgi:hypothetical protein